MSERLARSIVEPNVEDDCVRGVALVMAACHSLRYLISSSPDHSNDSLKEPELIGDPLEAVMLAECGWRMVTTADRVDMLSPVGEAVTVSIVAAFDFSADLARMSTIVRVGHKDGSAPQYMVLVKGSPESVARCSRANTVPEDFEKQVPFIRIIENLGFIIGAVSRLFRNRHVQYLHPHLHGSGDGLRRQGLPRDRMRHSLPIGGGAGCCQCRKAAARNGRVAA